MLAGDQEVEFQRRQPPRRGRLADLPLPDGWAVWCDEHECAVPAGKAGGGVDDATLVLACRSSRLRLAVHGGAVAVLAVLALACLVVPLAAGESRIAAVALLPAALCALLCLAPVVVDRKFVPLAQGPDGGEFVRVERWLLPCVRRVTRIRLGGMAGPPAFVSAPVALWTVELLHVAITAHPSGRWAPAEAAQEQRTHQAGGALARDAFQPLGGLLDEAAVVQRRAAQWCEFVAALRERHGLPPLSDDPFSLPDGAVRVGGATPEPGQRLVAFGEAAAPGLVRSASDFPVVPLVRTALFVTLAVVCGVMAAALGKGGAVTFAIIAGVALVAALANLFWVNRLVVEVDERDGRISSHRQFAALLGAGPRSRGLAAEYGAPVVDRTLICGPALGSAVIAFPEGDAAPGSGKVVLAEGLVPLGIGPSEVEADRWRAVMKRAACATS